MKYEDWYEAAKRAKMTNAQAKKWALEKVEEGSEIGAIGFKGYLFIAVLCVWFLWFAFTTPLEPSSEKTLFCNPASGVCSEDSKGKKRKEWNDALESASGG